MVKYARTTENKLQGMFLLYLPIISLEFKVLCDAESPVLSSDTLHSSNWITVLLTTESLLNSIHSIMKYPLFLSFQPNSHS